MCSTPSSASGWARSASGCSRRSWLLAAWTAQLVGGYLLLDFGCAGGARGGAIAPWVLALSAGCGAIALAATVVAARRARVARGAGRALYLGALLLDALSLVTIAFGAVLPLAFGACLRA